MIKSITNFPIIFFIFQQLKSQISQIDQNGYDLFCDETLHIFITMAHIARLRHAIVMMINPLLRIWLPLWTVISSHWNVIKPIPIIESNFIAYKHTFF